MQPPQPSKPALTLGLGQALTIAAALAVCLTCAFATGPLIATEGNTDLQRQIDTLTAPLAKTTRTVQDRERQEREWQEELSDIAKELHDPAEKARRCEALEPRRAKCYARLVQIHTALWLYADLHNDDFPQSLADLYDPDVHGPQCFVCPSASASTGPRLQARHGGQFTLAAIRCTIRNAGQPERPHKPRGPARSEARLSPGLLKSAMNGPIRRAPSFCVAVCRVFSARKGY